jgi:L,D-transpeptidase catalytic domain
MTLSRRRLLVAPLLASFGFAKAQSKPVKEYTFGRFTVQDFGSYQEISGAEFSPGPFPPQIDVHLRDGRRPRHVLYVDYTRKELMYYVRDQTGTLRPRKGYVILTPLPQELPTNIVEGEVVKIVMDPVWCPLQEGQIRRDYPELPGGCIPAGHPQNVMGKARFDIAWPYAEWRHNRLHGAWGLPEDFEQMDTYGCIQLLNEHILELIAVLGPNAVAEGIKVVAYRRQLVLGN